MLKGFLIPIRLGVYQVAASDVPFHKVVDAAKELEMIRREGFEHERARGLVIQVIMVVLRLGVGVTRAEVITHSPVDPFMLLYQRLTLVTLVITHRARCILWRVHLLDL